MCGFKSNWGENIFTFLVQIDGKQRFLSINAVGEGSICGNDVVIFQLKQNKARC